MKDLALRLRGDNNEIVKTHWWLLKKFSPELLEQFQPNLAQSLLGLYGFNLFQMKD